MPDGGKQEEGEGKQKIEDQRENYESGVKRKGNRMVKTDREKGRMMRKMVENTNKRVRKG